MSDSDSRLCQACAEMDVKALLSNFTQGSERQIRIGSRDLPVDGATVSCDLCRLFHQVRLPSGDKEQQRSALAAAASDGKGEEQKDTISYDIWIASFLAMSSEVRAASKFADVDRPCLVVIASAESSRHALIKLRRAGSAPLIVPRRLTMAMDAATDGYEVVETAAGSIDYKTVEKWIDECDRMHAGCRATPSLLERAQDDPKLRRTRMIDCDARRIVKYAPGQIFVALSYVCGVGPAKAPDWRARAGDALPERLARTVEDALRVTRTLGYRYLWFDQYCIDQVDEGHRASQIASMEKLYGLAQVTIIATGPDMDQGLPGVSFPRTWEYRSVDISGLTLEACPRRPECLLIDSKWSTRGWTYQEGVLSNRRLVFTEEQLYFECNETYHHECLKKPLRYLCDTDRQALVRRGFFYNRSQRNPSYEDRPRRKRIDDFRDHLYVFLERDLTYESDILNAFQGVRNTFKVPVICGTPLFDFPDMLPKDEQSMQVMIAVALCWAHSAHRDENISRRASFPSFCWAGWSGRPALTFGWAGGGWHGNPSDTGISDLGLPTAEARVLNWRETALAESIPGTLSIEGLVAQVGLCFHENYGWTGFIMQYQWRICDENNVPIHREGGFVGFVDVPLSCLEEIGAQRDKDGFLCHQVELVKLGSRSGSCWSILVVRRNEGAYAERVGLLELSEYETECLRWHRTNLELR